MFVFTVRGDGPFWRAGRNPRLFGAVALSAAVALMVLAVPAVGDSFGAVALSAEQWLAAMALAVVPFVVPELWKLGRPRLAPAASRPRPRRAASAGS